MPVPTHVWTWSIDGLGLGIKNRGWFQHATYRPWSWPFGRGPDSPILRGRNPSPWSLTTETNWDDPSTAWESTSSVGQPATQPNSCILGKLSYFTNLDVPEMDGDPFPFQKATFSGEVQL